MRQEELRAKLLAARLRLRRIDARVKGAGVHWRVDVRSTTDRSVSIDCFWYDREISALMLGMNPANARSGLGAPTEPRNGPEYAIQVNSADECDAVGRTNSMGEAIRCVRGWLRGASLEELVVVVPFLDRMRRELQAIGARLDSRLAWKLGPYSDEIWLYGGQRSCCVKTESCSFLIGQQQVAFSVNPCDPAGDVAAWLLEGATLAQLAERGADVERHAEVLEIDPARWHWLHVRDRIADPNDVLAPLAPLIRVLMESPIASRFYTYSSLYRLCFSPSSHYPFVASYPVIWPTGQDGKYIVDDELCSLEHAVAKIEAALEASQIEPFFGSGTEYEARLIGESLVRQGSTLRPELIRRGAWASVWLIVGARRCRLSESIVECFGPDDEELGVVCANLDDAVALAVRFVEKGVDIEQIAADPRVLQPYAERRFDVWGTSS